MHRVLTWFVAALALALVAPAAMAQRQGQGEVNSLALRLYDALSAVDPSKNVFFSPLSIATAFSFLHLGARGNTRRQLETTFGFGDKGVADNLRSGSLVMFSDAPGEVDFLLANGLFLQAGLELQESFRNGVANSESTGLEEVNFAGDPEGSRMLVNDFVNRSTRGNIVELMPPGSVTPDTVLVVANAVFFQAAWKFPFFVGDTADRQFDGFAGGSSTVPMMSQRESLLKIGEVAGAQILKLPYEGDMASMLIVLPKERTADAFSKLETTLQGMTVQELESNTAFKEVNVYLPRFEVEDSTNLKAILSQLGVVDLFQPSADLSGIVSTATAPLMVSSAQHKAKVQVDEQGTVASGATGVSVVAVSAAVSVEVFNADHPFIYFIIDNNGTILFMGNVRGLSA